MKRRRCQETDVGESLIEILLAIAILGIASTGLIAGLSAGVFASDSHRRLSSGESVLRSYGELVKDKVLHPSSTTTTADVGPFTEGDTITVPVASTASFVEATPYTVSLDGAIVRVTGRTATSFTGKALAGGIAVSGATVARYESCPGPSYFLDILATHPEFTTVDRLAPPTIPADGIKFYDFSNTLVDDCADYHTEPGKTFCAFTPDWRTRCDPPWMRVSLNLISTDSGRSKSTFSTDIIIRRVP